MFDWLVWIVEYECCVVVFVVCCYLCMFGEVNCIDVWVEVVCDLYDCFICVEVMLLLV